MSAAKHQELDCTSKCRLRQHGNCITAALTKRSIESQKLATFIFKSCGNFANILDDLGRSAVHMSASVARYEVLEWLLNNGAYINGKDYESGSSPLHRALYYGSIDCAALLMRYGASLDLLDEDTRCPLQAICRKCDDLNFTTDTNSQNDILVWGSSKNYNLGIGDEQSSTNAPQAVDFFRKANIWIEQVALGAYHSLFLDTKGFLYAVGHGKGGRLGNGNENSLPSPKRVKLPIKNQEDTIICISVSRQHSLVLTQRSIVFACGINSDHQLGVRDAPDQLNQFKFVDLKGASDLLKVIACDQHSIAYSSKCVYVWGANQGQFGLGTNHQSIAVPTQMKLPAKTVIRFVEANNAATVIFTEEKIICLYYGEKTKHIKTPNYENLKSIAVMGGNVKSSAKGSAAALKLLMLTETNVIFLWYENTQQFYRCTLSPIRLPEIQKVLYKCNQVLILSRDGCVYRGKCNQVALPPTSGMKKSRPSLDENWHNNDQNRTEISQDHIVRLELTRLPNIDRAVDICCDESFASFAALQESPNKYFRKPPLPRREHTFKKLYHDTSDSDAVHDVVFHVDGESFAAHKFIIYSRANGLRELMMRYLDKDIYLNFENLTGKMFELILKIIYTNYSPTEDDIDCIQQSLDPNLRSRTKAVETFLTYINKFQISYLSNLQVLTNQSQLVKQKQKKRIHRSDYPELYDVRVICDDSKVLDAHKCILVARLEYFEMMFMHSSWVEHSTVTMEGVPIEYMEPILDYLYDMDTEAFCKQNYTESFLYNMIIICDQYFIESLQNVCESLILDKISIRKCGEMLEFATMYNCKLLEKGSMDFICQNLARVLSYRSIEQCDQSTLKLLNGHYRKMFSNVFDYRQITPFSEAIDDELILSFVDGFEVDLKAALKFDEASVAKQSKQKEIRKQDARHQYEQQAITSMMRTLSTSDGDEVSKPTLSPGNNQAANDAMNWSKVKDKKEKQRKLSEQQQEQELPPLEKAGSKEQTPPPQPTSSKAIPISPPDESSSPLSKSYNLDLSSFTPQSSQKLSQKQRKRLSSESKSWRSPAPTLAETPPQPVPNAWGLPANPTPVSSSFNESFNSPATGSSTDPTSFANMMRASTSSGANATSPQDQATNSFSRILSEERRQRESYERMRNKSLYHTQIEETAIAELKEFYNVDNVDDEYITVERKSRPTDINFSTWLRH